MSEVTMLEFLPHFQIVALVVNVLLVLFIMPLRRSIDNLQKSDEGLTQRVHALEIKIAENYVQRSEITASLLEMDHKLERIEKMIVSHMVQDAKQ